MRTEFHDVCCTGKGNGEGAGRQQVKSYMMLFLCFTVVEEMARLYADLIM
jgi:hypothetical protein